MEKNPTNTAMSPAIVSAHAQRVALSIYVILKHYFVSNHDSHDVLLPVMMMAIFSISEVLSMCYNSDFNLSRDESSCNEGKEVHTYRKP